MLKDYGSCWGFLSSDGGLIWSSLLHSDVPTITCVSPSSVHVNCSHFIIPPFPHFLHGCRVPSLKPRLFFCFCPPPPSLPPLSPTHQQPVKVKRKKSFNLSRKFPFYKSKENIVADLVESEREYQLCDPGEGVALFLHFFIFYFFVLFPLHAWLLSSSIFPLTSRDGLCLGSTLPPAS